MGQVVGASRYTQSPDPVANGELLVLLLFILDSEIIESGFIMILRCKTGVCKIAVDMAPLTQTTIIEHLQLVSNDKGNYTATQTFLEHDKTSNTPITILERVYLFETDMEVENVF